MRTLKRTFFIALVLSSGTILARTLSPVHQSMNSDLENALNWAKHLREETRKGQAMDMSHVGMELERARGSLETLEASTNQLGKESPADLQEGHFIALKSHEKKALELLTQIEGEHIKSRPGFSQMKAKAKQLVEEIELAKHEHQLEMTEIEQHPEM